jgi:hypothetical protein
MAGDIFTVLITDNGNRIVIEIGSLNAAADSRWSESRSLPISAMTAVFRAPQHHINFSIHADFSYSLEMQKAVRLISTPAFAVHIVIYEGCIVIVDSDRRVVNCCKQILLDVPHLGCVFIKAVKNELDML